MLAAAPSDALGWHFPSENIDPAVAPSHDFYEFAVGGWRKEHPIPADDARWGVFDALAAATRDKLHGLLEDAAAHPAAEPGELRKVGDFFASGMDEEAIEAAGLGPLEPELERIDGVDGPDALEAELWRLQEMGVDAVFDFGKMPDPAASTLTIGVADQGGLGMPDPSYYLAADQRSQAIRDAYTRTQRRCLG